MEEFDILGDVDGSPSVTRDNPQAQDTMSLTSASGVSSVSVSTPSTRQHHEQKNWLPQTPETVQSRWQDSKPDNYKEKEIFDTASVSSLPTYNQVSLFFGYFYHKSSRISPCHETIVE